MRLDRVRICDPVGNTFLHKLAVTRAPWEYFDAAIGAGVNPRHQNAYGQTFAHVPNVAKFHDSLIRCFFRLRTLGIDFNL
jgi:hypothetical protein